MLHISWRQGPVSISLPYFTVNRINRQNNDVAQDIDKNFIECYNRLDKLIKLNKIKLEIQTALEINIISKRIKVEKNRLA